MYQYIMIFQIGSIVLAGCLLGLICLGVREIQQSVYGSLIGTMLGFFLIQAGYGIFLQALTLEGLQLGEMLCRIGKILAVTFWILTCLSLGKIQKKYLQGMVWIIALTGCAFAYLAPLRRMLRRHDEIKQNQYFYYIEGDVSWIFTLGCVFLTLGLVFAIFLLVRNMKYTSRKREGLWLILATLFPLLGAMIPQRISRYYDVIVPASLLSQLFIVSLVCKTGNLTFAETEDLQNSIRQSEKNGLE